MKRLLTTLVALGLIAFAGYKAVVWWQADQRLSEARTALEVWGVLERGVISSGIDGRLILVDSNWQDFRLTQPLHFGRIEVDTGSPVNLLKALANPSHMPENWTVRAEGLSLILEATMFRNWVTVDNEGEEGQPVAFVLPCAPDARQQISSGDLMRMGITDLAGEILIRQNAEGLHAELNTTEMGSIELNWRNARLNLLDPKALLEATAGPMELIIRDSGLMRSITAYCARESDKTTQEWTALVVDALVEGLKAKGLAGSKQLLALYHQWLVDGGELALMLNPSQPNYGVPIHGTDIEPATAELGVEYNGARVPDVYLKKVMPAIAQSATTEPTPVAPPENPDIRTWYPDTIENAAKWVDYKVRVTLSNDNKVEGRLVNVGERELEVARVVAGGEVAYSMLVRAVAKFEVWRRGRTE